MLGTTTTHAPTMLSACIRTSVPRRQRGNVDMFHVKAGMANAILATVTLPQTIARYALHLIV